jgi:hypothetical protein
MNAWSSISTFPHVCTALRSFKNRDNEKSKNFMLYIASNFHIPGEGGGMSISCLRALETETALGILTLRYVVLRYHNLTS